MYIHLIIYQPTYIHIIIRSK